MVENIPLLFQDVTTVNIDRFGSLHNWIHKDSNKECWNQLVACLLNPRMPLPERPEAWGPLPSWRARRDTSNQCPADYESDDDDDDGNDNNHNTRNDSDNKSRERQQPPPSPRRTPPPHEPRSHRPPYPAQYEPKRWLNDPNFCKQVGRSMFHSLTILGLGLGASETKIKLHYRQLACKYHPDKKDPAITGLPATEASDFFKLLKNAQAYLKERM